MAVDRAVSSVGAESTGRSKKREACRAHTHNSAVCTRVQRSEDQRRGLSGFRAMDSSVAARLHQYIGLSRAAYPVSMNVRLPFGRRKRRVYQSVVGRARTAAQL